MDPQLLKELIGGGEMTRIAFFLLLFATLAGCAYTRTLPPADIVVQKVVEAPGVTKEEIFDKSRIWFARSFRQSMARWQEQNERRTVIQYENEGKGIVIGNGAILYPHEGLTSESYKTGWEVRFTLEIEAKEGKARVTFSRLTMFVPSVICGYYSYATSSYERVLEAEELAKVRPVFLDLAEQLGAFLKGPGEKW